MSDNNKSRGYHVPASAFDGPPLPSAAAFDTIRHKNANMFILGSPGAGKAGDLLTHPRKGENQNE